MAGKKNSPTSDEDFSPAKREKKQSRGNRSSKKIPPVVARMLAEAKRQSDAYDSLDASVVTEADNLQLALKPTTDLGNAERFVERFRSNFIHIEALEFLRWDGQRWSREGAEEHVNRAVHETSRAIQREADALTGSPHDFVIQEKRDGKEIFQSDKLRAWGRASEASNHLSAIAKHAAPYLTVDRARLDADPFRINVSNGTLTINPSSDDGEDPISFSPHSRSDHITKLAPVRYDPDATCPRYDRFLNEVQPVPEMQRFINAWGGYSTIGDTGEQKLAFFYGKGRNGKSTLVDIWAEILGDYGQTTPIETFLEQGRGRNAGGPTPDLAILPGVRFLRTSEPEKNSKLAEAFIKVVTGGEPILARHLHSDYFKFRPTFKLTMSGNCRPTISGTDEGIWRRVILVPWSVTVANPDTHLLSHLRTELSGILNRLLDGLRDYIENGLVLPQDVAEATENYRDDSDPLGRFLKVAVEAAPGNRVASRRMHAVYSAWAKAAGEREWSPKGLASALKEKGYRSKQSNVMWWIDCALTKDEADFSEPTDRSLDDEGEAGG